MSFYNTDIIDINHYTINAETGVKVLEKTVENVKCRVETYNSTILSIKGKEEIAKYLVIIDNDDLIEGDGITVKSVMGRNITKKEYDVKRILYVGGRKCERMECYLC